MPPKGSLCVNFGMGTKVTHPHRTVKNNDVV